MEIKIEIGKPQIVATADLTLSHEVMTGKSLVLLYVIDGKVICSEFAAENKAAMDGLANAFRNAAKVAKGKCKSKKRG